MRIARVRALIIVCTLALIAASVAAWAITHDSQANGGSGCPAGSLQVSVKLPEVSEVTVTVLNGTETPGLADTTADVFEERGFNIGDTGDSDNHPETYTMIHYGPKAVGAAHLVRSYIPGTEPVFDRDRESENVTVVLGPNFRQLRSESESRQALGILGRPQAPEGTCAVD